MLIDRITNILLSAGNNNSNIPSTDLFNEGWMLRLVLGWFSTHPDVAHELNIANGERWYSEALLPSQFKTRGQGDNLAESRTHADGVIGKFEIGKNGDGDLSLYTGAAKLTVIEAKMFSKLSAGVKNAKYYNQAARNVACIAEVLYRTKTPPLDMAVGFHVVAPASCIDEGKFSHEMDRDHIRGTVERRVGEYDGTDKEEKETWFKEWFLPVFDVARISQISWENILCAIEDVEPSAGKSLKEFYTKCLKYNSPTAKRKRANEHSPTR